MHPETSSSGDAISQEAASDAQPGATFRLTMRQFHIVAAFILALSLLKGIHLPSRFALTYFLFAYDGGFIRRGLFGSLFAAFQPLSYWPLAAIAMILLAALVLIGWRLLEQDLKQGIAASLPWLVLLASPGLVFLVHIVGYLDYLLFIGLWTLLLFARRIDATKLAPLCWLLAPVSILIHEAAIAFVVPTLFVLVVARAKNMGTAIRDAGILSVIAIGTVVAALHFGSIPLERMSEYDAAFQDRATFEVRLDAVEALYHRVGERIGVMQEINANPQRPLVMIKSFLLFFPATIFFVWAGIRQWRAARGQAGSWLVGLAVIGIALAPLSLHIVAYDLQRWNAHTTMAAFTGWLAMVRCRDDGARPVAVSLMATLMIVFLSLASTNYFFGTYEPAHYPAYGDLRDFLSWGDDTAIP